MSTLDRPLRRDAQRNRERILAAAGELFAERGLNVTLDDVAARAGLGVGTVYRRFASRDELIDALFEHRIGEIVALAESAAAEPDPWLALCGFLERMCELQARDRGLKEVMLGTAEGRGKVSEGKARIGPVVAGLVIRAKAAGALRADLDRTDLPLLQMMLGAIAEVSPPDRPELWRRHLRIILDGLRARPGPPSDLREPPLPFEALEDVMCRYRPAGRRPAG